MLLDCLIVVLLVFAGMALYKVMTRPAHPEPAPRERLENGTDKHHAHNDVYAAWSDWAHQTQQPEHRSPLTRSWSGTWGEDLPSRPKTAPFAARVDAAPTRMLPAIPPIPQEAKPAEPWSIPAHLERQLAETVRVRAVKVEKQTTHDTQPMQPETSDQNADWMR